MFKYDLAYYIYGMNVQARLARHVVCGALIAATTAVQQLEHLSNSGAALLLRSQLHSVWPGAAPAMLTHSCSERA